jgi:uncharacterized protein YjbI with pentapeptide repeats
MCTYSLLEYSCPFESEADEELCIFHLPVDKKDANSFWKHLASYIVALVYKEVYSGTTSIYKDTADVHLKRFVKRGTAWIFHEYDESLLKNYRLVNKKSSEWKFVGFEFPPMDDIHNFQKFYFLSTNFMDASFNGKASFDKSVFSGNAEFRFAEFYSEVRFWETKFHEVSNFYQTRFFGLTTFLNATFFKEVYFESTKFLYNVLFDYSIFRGNVFFNNSIILKQANINFATFHKEVNCLNMIVNILDLSNCEIFSYFRLREIQKLTFQNEADFEMQIEECEKNGNTSEKHILESYITLRGQKPIILLRNIRFWSDGHLLLEDFDVSKTSFWQTNFHIIRPRIDFVRVNWGKEKLSLMMLM